MKDETLRVSLLNRVVRNDSISIKQIRRICTAIPHS